VQWFIPSGVAVCSFQVATKRPSGRNVAGEGLVEAEWTTVEAWEKLAKRCVQVLHKDSRVWIVGTLHTHQGGPRDCPAARQDDRPLHPDCGDEPLPP
jgi:single-strand DNA-binding protein